MTYEQIQQLSPEQKAAITELYLYGTIDKDEDLPDDFFEAFPQVQNLSYCLGNDTIPASLGSLSQLRTLNITGKKVKTLPDSISQLTQLEEICISHNQQIDLKKEVVKLKQLPRLYYLEIWSMWGKKFANNLHQLPHLKHIKLRYDILQKKLSLSDLFDAIAHIQTLEDLEVSVSNLSPKVIELLGNMPQLKRLHLDISPGDLNELSLEFGHFKTLEIMSNYQDKKINMLAEFQQKYAHINDHYQLELLFGAYTQNLEKIQEKLKNILLTTASPLSWDNVQVTGKLKGLKIKELKPLLKEKGLGLNLKNKSNNLYVITAKADFNEVARLITSNQPLISEDHLKEWLTQHKQENYNSEQLAEFKDKIMRLMMSHEDENYLLAFQLIEGLASIDKEVESILVAIMAGHSNPKVHKAAEKTLRKTGTTLLLDKIKALRISFRRISKTNSKRALARLAREPLLDFVSFYLMNQFLIVQNQGDNSMGLNCGNLPITHFGPILKYFTYIKYIDLGKNKLFDLAKSLPYLKELPNLIILDLANTGIVIPAEIAQLTQITRLNINHCKVPHPEVLGQFTQLYSLEVAGCKITDWQWLAQLPNLGTLDISKNKLDKIPDEVFRLKELNRLIAKQNKLIDAHIDMRFKEIANLYLLDLSGNQLKTLPEVLGYLPQLHDIRLRSNQIADFDITQILLKSKVSQLAWNIVDLGKNKLSAIDITQIPNLKELDISHNQITQLDKSLFESHSLQHLLASHNQIQVIPTIIGERIIFHKLDLSFNKITHLPQELDLVSFSSLSLKNNEITTADDALLEQTSTKRNRIYWNLDNNPIAGTDAYWVIKQWNN